MSGSICHKSILIIMEYVKLCCKRFHFLMNNFSNMFDTVDNQKIGQQLSNIHKSPFLKRSLVSAIFKISRKIPCYNYRLTKNTKSLAKNELPHFNIERISSIPRELKFLSSLIIFEIFCSVTYSRNTEVILLGT